MAFSNLQNPTEHNLNNVHNFYIHVEPEVKIGVWHFIPKQLNYNYEQHSARSNHEHFQAYFKNNEKPIMIYVHGNDRDRSSPFRVELCTKLENLGLHVFAIDYRGYGDSTGTPTESGVVEDVLALFRLIQTYQPNTKIFLYGHSLGTAIVCHTAKLITEFNYKLDGVILEAPFLNASQAGKDYHLSKLLNNNRWSQQKTDESLEIVGIRFNSDKNILKIKTKIVIFHAEDDSFVPFSHGKELFRIAQAERPKDFGPVEFYPYGKELGLGHFLQSHDHLYEIIKKFVESA